MKNIIILLLCPIIFAGNDSLSLSVNNKSDSKVKVTTGRVLTNSYFINEHSSKNYWYFFSSVIWNMKFYVKDQNSGDYRPLTNCEPSFFYDHAITVEFYNTQSGQVSCSIYNY